MAMDNELSRGTYVACAGRYMDEQTARCLRLYIQMLQVLVDDLRGEPSDIGASGKYKGGKTEILRKQARGYLHSQSREEGAYLWVCEILGIDPSYIREAEISGDILLWEKKCNSSATGLEYYLVRR